MPTPMSPVTSHSEAEVLKGALTALAEGRVTISAVKGLSDLSRGGRDALAAVWPTLPETIRRRVTRQMGKLAEERIELHFGRALRVALDDESPVVRQLAVAALWEDDGSDVCGRLTSVAGEDRSLEVRTAALRGLNRFATEAGAGSLDDKTAHALRSTLIRLAQDRDQPSAVRRLAVEALGPFGDAEVRAVIEEAFGADDVDDRLSAMVAMGRSMLGSWLPTLLRDAEADDTETRVAALQAIGQIGDDRAVGALATAGTDPDSRVRIAAFNALARIGGQAATKALRNLEASALPADRESIVESLAGAQGEQLPF